MLNSIIRPGHNGSAGPKACARHQVTAGAAFAALVNTLVIALVTLLSRASLGETGAILAAIGYCSVPVTG